MKKCAKSAGSARKRAYVKTRRFFIPRCGMHIRPLLLVGRLQPLTTIIRFSNGANGSFSGAIYEGRPVAVAKGLTPERLPCQRAILALVWKYFGMVCIFLWPI